MEISESQEPALFYATLEIGENNNANKTIVTENRLELHSMGINEENMNICQEQSLKTSLITYFSN